MARQDVKIRRAGSYEIVYSSSADRSNPQPLNGAVVSGVIYVFLTPTTSASSASFWKPLHPTVFRVDSSAPFDLVGADVHGNATALNVSDHWVEGPAELSATVLAADGVFTATAEFTASEGATQPEDATYLDETGAIAGSASVATPTIVILDAPSTATPSTIGASTTVPAPGVSAAGDTSLKDAVGYFTGNGTSGSNDASAVLDEFETHVGRRLGFASSNFGTKCTTSSLSGCTTSASADTVTKAGHGLTTKDTVHMTSATQAGITSSTAYWVVNPNSAAGTFQLATSKNGTPLNITADVTVDFVKHVYIGAALSAVDNFYRPEWALRPDVQHCVIFHMWQVAQVTNQQKSPPPAFRRSRRLEVIAGDWDSVYNSFFNKLHRAKSGASYAASTGTVTDSGHGHYAGERLIVTAQATTTAFTTSTEASPTYYYVMSPTSTTYKLTTTPPWDWEGTETAVTGGGNGTINTLWRFNIVFRISHEGDIPYSGGYPDGRLWDGITADDETKCRQSWEHVCDLIHDHGFKAIWAGNGNMFLRINQIVSDYSTNFPDDVRKCWEYGLPGTTGSAVSNLTGVKATYDGSGNHTGGYIDYLDLDVYYGANGSGGTTTTNALARIDSLISAAGDVGVPWSIAEIGIFFVSKVGPTNVSATAYDANNPTTTGIFTASNGHGFADNMPVVVGYAGTAPSPIKKNDGTVYYVDYVSTTQFGLRASSGGARIRLTSDGSGLSIKRWAQIPDTTSGPLMSAKDWLNAVWDKAAADLANCHYINYFWAGGDSSTSFFTRTNLKIWAPGAYQAVYGTGRLAGA